VQQSLNQSFNRPEPLVQIDTCLFFFPRLTPFSRFQPPISHRILNLQLMAAGSLVMAVVMMKKRTAAMKFVENTMVLKHLFLSLSQQMTRNS